MRSLRASQYRDPIAIQINPESGMPITTPDVMMGEQVLMRARFWGGWLQSVYLLFTLVSLWFTYWFPILNVGFSGYTILVSFTHFRSVHSFLYSQTCGWTSFTAVKYVTFFQIVLIFLGFIQVFAGIYVTVVSDDYRQIFGIMGAVSGGAIVLLGGMTARSCREVEAYVVPLALSTVSRTDPTLVDEDFMPRARSLVPGSQQMSTSIYAGRGGSPRGGFVGPSAPTEVMSPDDGFRLTDHHKPPVAMQRDWRNRPNPREPLPGDGGYNGGATPVRSALRGGGGGTVGGWAASSPSPGFATRRVVPPTLSSTSTFNHYDEDDWTPTLVEKDNYSRRPSAPRAPPKSPPPARLPMPFGNSPTHPPVANPVGTFSRSPVLPPRNASVSGTYKQ